MSSFHLRNLIMDFFRKNKSRIEDKISVPLDEFIEKQFHFTDSVIADSRIRERLTYSAGKLVVSAPDEDADNFSVVVDLYFTNELKKIINKKTEINFRISAIDEASRKEILEKKSISYDIEPTI